MGKAENGQCETEAVVVTRKPKQNHKFDAQVIFKMFPRKGQAEKDTGFTVCKARRLDTNEEVVLKGAFGPVEANDQFKVLQSVYQKDLRQNWHYNVKAVAFDDPTTEDAIVAHIKRLTLSKAAAEQAYFEFGNDAIKELDADPSFLDQFSDATNMAEAWKAKRQAFKNQSYLNTINFTNIQAQCIARHFGDVDVRQVIAYNPYLLCDVDRIKFDKIDQMAVEDYNIGDNDPRRLTALVVDNLKQAEDDGHICLTYDDLFEISSERIENLDRDAFERMIKTERDRGVVHIEEDRVYALENYVIETRLLEQINEMIDDTPASLPPGWGQSANSNLTQEQFQAAENAMTSRISVLLGSAGTGKTTSMKELIEIARNSGKSVACLAPTGKAAKRVEEATGIKASTIHRVLGFTGMEPPNPHLDRYRDDAKVIKDDIVIVDEASMLDMRVAERLFSHVSPKSHVVLVGDPNQLPPVGAGSVLLDVAESGKVPTTKLTKIFRQAEDSLLVVNANRVRKGEEPFWSKDEAEKELGRPVKEDWVFIEENDPNKVIQRVVQMSDADPDALVTSPTRMAKTGVKNLNAALQNKFNANGKVVLSDFEIGEVRVGDKVMNTQNIYRGKHLEDVMNGDTGTLLHADVDTVTVDFGFGDPVVLQTQQAEGLIPAYAATTHKLQGTEAETIICPFAGSGGEKIASRNMLYTAWTRGKEKCVVIGEREKIIHALGIDGLQRSTSLNLKLAEKEIREHKENLADLELKRLANQFNV